LPHYDGTPSQTGSRKRGRPPLPKADGALKHGPASPRVPGRTGGGGTWEGEAERDVGSPPVQPRARSTDPRPTGRKPGRGRRGERGGTRCVPLPPTTTLSWVPFIARVRLPSVPSAASGTLSSLCRVLCTLRSLYLCTIGLVSIFKPCEGYTSRIQVAVPSNPTLGCPRNGSVVLCHPDPYTPALRVWYRIYGTVTPYGERRSRRPAAPTHTATRMVPPGAPITPHRRLLKAVQRCTRPQGWDYRATSLAATEAIAVALFSSAY